MYRGRERERERACELLRRESETRVEISAPRVSPRSRPSKVLALDFSRRRRENRCKRRIVGATSFREETQTTVLLLLLLLSSLDMFGTMCSSLPVLVLSVVLLPWSCCTAQRFDLSSLSLRAAVRDGAFGCPERDVHFELVTGHVYTAPDDMLDSRPGTLMLTDCIELCRRNATCKSANFETGLCVLFGSSAEEYPGKERKFFLLLTYT